MRHFLLPCIFALIACWHCQPVKAPKVTASVEDKIMMTHQEARDTLRADTTQPLLPSTQSALSLDSARLILNQLDLSTLLVNTWPDNGFYGNDRYRIEFIIQKMEKTINDPLVYAVGGKNRFKKTISPFEGFVEIKQMSIFNDINLDSAALADMGFVKTYSINGDFSFREDSSMVSSGHFSGTFKMDFGVKEDGTTELWFFTEDTPAAGCGYRFDGEWIGYKNQSNKKPVVWSRDLFRFANDILSEFSYGERDVEINEKYRHLGWETYWDGEEWWTDARVQ